MKTEAVEINVPDKAADPLAHIVCERWNQGIRWRNHERVGKFTVTQTLHNCYDQMHGIVCAGDQAIIDEVGVDAYVNLTELKSGALDAWMRDLLLNTPDLPYTIKPTPVPELSKSARREVLNNVKRELFVNGYDGDLTQMVRAMKAAQLTKEQDYANNAAVAMYQLMKDQAVQGNFDGALLQFIREMSVYPYAVMYGPIPTMVTRTEWSGDRIVQKDVVEFMWKNVSVWDFVWTPDSPDTQRGTGVCIRERMTKHDLYRCATMSSYIQKNIEKVVEECTRGSIKLDWLSNNPEQQDEFRGTFVWGSGAMLDVLRHYGKFSGRELRKYGINAVEDGQFYEASVTVVGGYTIQAFINPNPAVNIRPVYASSFQRTADRIPGSSVAQKIRDVERVYMATLRYLLKNGSYAASPIGEVDWSRVSEYMSEDDIGLLAPDTLYPVAPDMTGGGRPAHYFHTIPSNMPAYLGVMNYFMDLSDRITQIPAAIHGEPVGTGANRTFRGISLLQGNAMRPIQSALMNIDKDVFKPMGTLQYNYNMRYVDEDSIKGDCLVEAQGATGLLQQEMQKQTAMETLQIVAQTGASGMVDPRVVQWAVNQVLEKQGVPIQQILSQPMPAMPGQPGGVPQQPGGAPPAAADVNLPTESAT